VSSWLSNPSISCPYCGESMSVVIDLSAGAQRYIEDCQICCQPMQICFDVDGDRLMDLRIERAG
jgi:transcription elongation factor Elf1